MAQKAVHNNVMNLRSLIIAGLLVLPLSISAQTEAENKTILAGNQTMAKLQKIDICKFVLPVLFDKNELGILIGVLEKVRDNEIKLRETNAKDILKFDKAIDEAIEKAVNEQALPPKELQQDLIKTLTVINQRNALFTADSVKMVYEKMVGSVQKGKLKAIQNLMDPKSIDSSVKSETWTSEDKIKFYIQTVLLDGSTLNFLKLLYKNAK
jgi:hypothetical protein